MVSQLLPVLNYDRFPALVFLYVNTHNHEPKEEFRTAISIELFSSKEDSTSIGDDLDNSNIISINNSCPTKLKD